MPEKVLSLIAPLGGERKNLIPALQRVHEEMGYLPEEAIAEIAQFFRLSKNEVFGVASFYALFRFQRAGKYTVRVCQGTACHVRGGRRILETVERELNIRTGETTPDYLFSLERVACFGSCALAPVMTVNKTFYGRMTTAKARQILEGYRQEKQANE